MCLDFFAYNHEEEKMDFGGSVLALQEGQHCSFLCIPVPEVFPCLMLKGELLSHRPLCGVSNGVEVQRIDLQKVLCISGEVSWANRAQ